VSILTKSNVLLDDDDEAEYETDHEHNHVPPPRRLFVVLVHVCMMRVIKLSGLGGFESSDRIASPEENDMGDQCSDLKHMLELNLEFQW
jgi:hypothetical protein